MKPGAQVKGMDIDLEKLGKNPYSDAVLSQEDAHKVMSHLMGYYVKLSSVVRKKLVHASTATKKRLKDIEIAPEEEIEAKESVIGKYQRLDRLWEQFILVLSRSSMAMEDFEKINETMNALNFIPDSIRAYYDVLVQIDEELQSLIQEIGDEDYQQNYEQCKKIAILIQKGKNLISGLDETEYDYAGGATPVEHATAALVRATKDFGTIVTPDGRRVRIIY